MREYWFAMRANRILLAAGPFGLFPELVEHLAGLRHEENAFVLAAGKVLLADGPGVAVAKVYSFADGLRNAGGKRDLDAALFDAIFHAADSAHMGAVRKD